MTGKEMKMEMINDTPRLRVAPIPVEIQGRKMLMFQDPERFTEETVLMPLEAAVILQFFDGAHSVRQIQEELMRLTGELIDTEQIREIINQLDERLLLDSPRFHAHIRQLSEQWRAEKTRPPYHAGRAYPADREQLISFLDSCYTSPDGPGALPGPVKSKELKAIIAPHMDLNASGPAVAHAFKALAENTEASLFVIFGTGHMEPSRMFIPSDKDYETPLGVAPTDRELLERILKLRRERNPLDDYIHKQEHSIEFMVVFLQHALKDRPFKILPVLVSGMGVHAATGASPSEDPVFKDFMSALEKALSERDQKPVFIAAADLAHLGPRYGDQETWAPIRMAEEEAADREMLEPLLSGDAESFFQKIARIKDRRRICGFPCIYATMHAARPSRGELLKWSFWHDRDTMSVVSFASLAFY